MGAVDAGGAATGAVGNGLTGTMGDGVALGAVVAWGAGDEGICNIVVLGVCELLPKELPPKAPLPKELPPEGSLLRARLALEPPLNPPPIA